MLKKTIFTSLYCLILSPLSLISSEKAPSAETYKPSGGIYLWDLPSCSDIPYLHKWIDEHRKLQQEAELRGNTKEAKQQAHYLDSNLRLLAHTIKQCGR